MTSPAAVMTRRVVMIDARRCCTDVIKENALETS